MQLAKNNNGFLCSSMLDENGISRAFLNYLVTKGFLIHSSRGIYILPDRFSDEMFELQNKFKRGIYSNETSLYLWDLTDQTPINYSMSFPKGYNLTSAKRKAIKCAQKEKKFYDIGICEVKTHDGNKVKTYNMEKTLCDILKANTKINTQIITTAFKRYIKRKDKNIPLLSEYAKLIGVEEKVRSYLEVLL